MSEFPAVCGISTVARLARAVRVIAPANALTEAAPVGDEEVVSTSISANPVIAPIVPTLLNSPMKLSGRFILILETVLPLPSNVDANDLARAYRGLDSIGSSSGWDERSRARLSGSGWDRRRKNRRPRPRRCRNSDFRGARSQCSRYCRRLGRSSGSPSWRSGLGRRICNPPRSQPIRRRPRTNPSESRSDGRSVDMSISPSSPKFTRRSACGRASGVGQRQEEGGAASSRGSG